MKKQLIAFVFALLPTLAFAAGGSVHLDDFSPDLKNNESLQKGMKFFVENCMGCHSAQYQRYERAADDLGMDKAFVEENLIVGNVKIGNHMTIAMAKEDATKWFGAPPPDLSLEARLRGPAWIYTYLRGFYVDEARPWGVNNTIFKDVGMPHVLVNMQGVQVCNDAEHGCTENSQLELVKAGTMSPEEYDQAIYDLTNFMTYMGEPSRLQSEKIGTYALIFLAILFVFAYLLKKEYWKDVYSGSWRKNH